MRLVLKLDVVGDAQQLEGLDDPSALQYPMELCWDQEGVRERVMAMDSTPPSPREVMSLDRGTRREIRRRIRAAFDGEDEDVAVDDPFTAALLPIWLGVVPPNSRVVLAVRWHRAGSESAGGGWSVGDCRAVSLLAGLGGKAVDVVHGTSAATGHAVAGHDDLRRHVSQLQSGVQDYVCPPALGSAPCFEQSLRDELMRSREHDRQRISAIHSWQARVNSADDRTAVVTEQLRTERASRSIVSARLAAQRSGGYTGVPAHRGGTQ